MHRLTRIARSLAVTALALVACLAIPMDAVALDGLTTRDWTRCDGLRTAGSADERGAFYVSCGSGFYEVYNGTWKFHAIANRVYDIAPNADGSRLYAMVSGDFPAAVGQRGVRGVVRFVRQADGSYKRSAGWALDPFPAAGTLWYPYGLHVATDADGNVYTSNGEGGTPNMITKHAPDGTLLTHFGDWTSTAEPGKFNLNRGLAATRDGRSIYVVEKTGGRVQRFDIQPDGSYRIALEWGRFDEENPCRPGEFAAPGDVGLTAWGEVYITDTSCERMQVFTPDGEYITEGDLRARVHAVVVTIRGYVYGGERGNVQLTPVNGHAGEPIPPVQPPPAPGFAALDVDLCPNDSWTNGAGQGGEDGRVYIACEHSIAVADTSGALLGRIALPTDARYYDVAPSSDPDHLYVTRVHETQGRPELVRINRTVGEFDYVIDADWRPDDYILGGRAWTPQGRYFATDAFGNIYYSIGGWSGYYVNEFDGDFQWEPSPAIIVKYDATGSVITKFYGSDPELGEMDVNMGVAVSRDGRTVYTVEHMAARVRKFEMVDNGQYAATPGAAFGAMDGTCATDQGFAAPYDIGIDPWGSVWVANTTCGQVKQFDANGNLTYEATLGGLLHGIAVDLAGNVWVGDANIHMARSDDNPVPGPLPEITAPAPPDTEDPVLLGFDRPEVTTNQAFGIVINAFDNVGVADVRTATESGEWGDWQPFEAALTVNSSDGHGVKGVFVQVRDAAGNTSMTLYRTYEFQPVFDVEAPQLLAVDLADQVIGNDVILGIEATDDTGVTEARFANEDGTWGAWQPFNASTPHTLTEGAGLRGVFVQVRDAAGRESTVIYTMTLVLM